MTTKFWEFGKLPGKPSELLELAMRDLKLVQADPRYMVNMRVWHKPAKYFAISKTCFVCMAGSVMAKTMKLSPEKSEHPFMFNERDALLAINAFRIGCVKDAFSHLGIYNQETTPFIKNLELNIVKRFGYPDRDEGLDEDHFDEYMSRLIYSLKEGGY